MPGCFGGLEVSINPETSHLYGIILAGGVGARFWPLSRAEYPKQILRLMGSESMLQATINRITALIPFNRLIVITHSSQADIIKLELHRHGWENIALWQEPLRKNTAAAVALAAFKLQALDPEAILAVFPADHYVKETSKLVDGLKYGLRLAQRGFLVTFGIPPTRPETGYGYIETGSPLDPDGLAFKANAFIEKPNLVRAQAFLEKGNYYWNSGIFLFRLPDILEAFEKYLPGHYDSFRKIIIDDNHSDLLEIYKRLEEISIDHGIMEKASNLAVIPLDMGWSDVGSWGALMDLFPQDPSGNVTLGKVIDKDSRSCLFYAQDRLVATLGLQDTIVVDTPDATLVCHKNEAQRVKELVHELEQYNCAEIRQHLVVERPWGSYCVKDFGPGYKVKQVVVAPGKRLSLQLHNIRAEHWVVVQGIALATVGKQQYRLRANESIYVPPQTVHRLENPGTEPLVIIEVQTGSYLEEDDIVRFEDDFWREVSPTI